MKNKCFWETVEKCKKEVATWAKWKRDLVITAKNASTGNFYNKT